MKTIFSSIYKQQIPLQCHSLKNFIGVGSRVSSSLLSALRHRLQFFSPALKTRLSLKLRSVHVSKAVAFLAMIQALVKASLLNGRIYLALLIFSLSPLASAIHLLFNRKDHVEALAEYHENYFHLFNLIGPYIFILVVLFGVFLLVPPRQKTFKVFKHSLNIQISRMLSIPIGYSIAKIIWLCDTKSNEDFWSLPHWSYSAVGLAVGYVTYLLVEWLTWRKFHAFDGLIATIEGLYAIDLPEELRREKVLPLIKELKHFNNKY